MAESATWLTQCPECETKFWVKDSQLQAARGSVRCGSCKNVFKATEYFIDVEKGTRAKSTKAARGNKNSQRNKSPKKQSPNQNKNRYKDEEKKPNDFDSRLKKLSKENYKNQKPKKRYWLFWGLFDLLAVCTLAGQYIYFNFDQLSQQEEWYPVLNAVCAPIGCTIKGPPLSVAIITEQLVVRSAPSHKNVLAVDAVIRSRAKIPIPYPLVELRFTNKANQTVASRVFKPEEYLSGEMKNIQFMQPGQPTHFGLHVVDPGKHAVNYSLQFRPNNKS